MLLFVDQSDVRLLERATEAFGDEMMYLVFQEELGEGLTAIAQYRRGRITAEEVAEELADILVVTTQMAIQFDLKLVNEIANEKLERLRWRVQNDDPNAKP